MVSVTAKQVLHKTLATNKFSENKEITTTKEAVTLTLNKMTINNTHQFQKQLSVRSKFINLT